MSNKDKLQRLLKQFTEQHDFGTNKTFGLTAEQAAEIIGTKRNLISQILNQLNRDLQAVKINTRPVYFLDRESLEKRFDVVLTGDLIFNSFSELQKVIAGGHQTEPQEGRFASDSADVFRKLTGFDGSLKYQVEQCKVAIRYPPNGIPILITGPTGSGKSFLAQLMHEYAKQEKIIKNDAPFVIFNCAEYANNPELLSANLFGYVKGAFTGADRDYKGVIEEADGGYLFLDEVHRLPPEGQEKLFLFMDKGVFRRVGESKGWRKANVRFIFATTENPELILLSTFLRRIPINIHIPPLKDRPLPEKFNLIRQFFKEEARFLQHDILVSKQAFKVLLLADFKGNVGQLRNEIKFSCGRAYHDFSKAKNGNKQIEVNLMKLPENLANSVLTSQAHHQRGELLDHLLLHDVVISWRDEDPSSAPPPIQDQGALKHLTFYDRLFEFLRGFDNQTALNDFIGKATVMIDDYFDSLLFASSSLPKADVLSVRFETIRNCIQSIFEVLKNKYDLRYYDNIGYKIACFINHAFEYQYVADAARYERKFKRYLSAMKETFPREYGITTRIVDFIQSTLDISLGSAEKSVILLYLAGINRGKESNRIKAIIIAHGYSTASSIANVANHLLGENIFESFDMPLEVSSEEIVKKVTQYISTVDTSNGIVILVDMGSLEEIYHGLEKISHGVIGIINNITTQLALDTGSQILQGVSLEELVENVTTRNRSRFKVIRPIRDKRNAIITTCITGIGTAKKIKDLLVRSLDTFSQVIDIVPYDYLKLRDNGFRDNLFKEYNVLAIIGTKDPVIANVPFFSVEEIISGEKEAQFYNLFKDLIPVEGIYQINQSIIKNFSMESVLNYITILNPNKILDQIEMAVDALQYEMKMQFTNEIKICLYIHLSCLIERLVTKTQIDSYNTDSLKDFTLCHKKFIEIVKKSFSVIEKLYSVSMPLAEIYFIYEVLSTKLPDLMDDAK